jgi:hypothetical protein
VGYFDFETGGNRGILDLSFPIQSSPLPLAGGSRLDLHPLFPHTSEYENARLKKLVADLSLDKDALQWVIQKKGEARGPEGDCRAGARSMPSASGGRAGW